MIKDKINRGDDVREERQESQKARKRRNGVFLGKTTSGMFGTGIKISRVQYSRVGNSVFIEALCAVLESRLWSGSV